MSGRIEGERPRGELTPEQRQNSPEAGAGPLGLPPPDLEQVPPRGAPKSPEHQALPSVWDVLKRKVRLRVPESPSMTTAEYGRKLREVNRSIDEVDEKGTPRDKLIIRLYSAAIVQPGAGGPVFRRLSLEEFQQFRLQAESLSDEEAY